MRIHIYKKLFYITITNLQSVIQQHYRTDELYRLDLLEMLVKAKKFSVFELPCMDVGCHEDEEYILTNDKAALETQGGKRLRIKNFDAAWDKWRRREHNARYARALEQLRPACVGTGYVNFGAYDFGIHDLVRRTGLQIGTAQYLQEFEEILFRRLVLDFAL